MPKVVVPVEEKILRAAERRKAEGTGEDIAQFLAKLITLGFEHRLRQLYSEFEAGEISLEYFADDVGLGVRDLYEALEQRGLPTSSMGAYPSVAGD